MRRSANDGPFGIERLPQSAGAAIERLMAVVVGNDMVLPPEMLKAIAAISVEGADPKWQIDQLNAILDQWAAQQ